jgi:hypothetical protein
MRVRVDAEEGSDETVEGQNSLLSSYKLPPCESAKRERENEDLVVGAVSEDARLAVNPFRFFLT